MMNQLINKSRLSILFICLITLHAEKVMAQKNDSLSPLRDFVNISNGYKQMPLYLELEMKNSSNFITGEDDTTAITGEFYLRKENSYIHFGEFEQIINDSLALLVSDKLQQMILYTHAGPIVNKMKSMMGLSLPDSSIRKLAQKYTSANNGMLKGVSMIELKSRAVLYGTSLPKETIALQYDTEKKTPKQVTMLTRSLQRLDSLQYYQLKTEAEITEKLLMLEGSYFLIREQVTAYLYKQIEQVPGVKVPVVISDRIIKNEEGEYRPAKNYELYKLIRND